MIGIQGNFNKMPIPIPQSIPQPSEQEEIIEDQNLENIEGQDYITEVLNISKIKEGFYIGDKIAAISIEVVVQFKLTHMINASGNQIINQWETIGMKYLTLNWSENPNQILFDPNDEIADKILFFIDDSFINGEGLLAHSFKGQNRVCIVVLIYLMKKYKWSLKKSMEYLKSKKQDVDIPPFFLSQLIKFEGRLIQRGELSKDIPWSYENLKDPEEKLLRNTYINGLNIINKSNKNDVIVNYNKDSRHIIWADSNPFQQIPLSVIDLDKDLFFKKNIRPIFPHQQKRVLKPCIKNKKKNNFINNNLQKDKENDEKNMRQNLNNNIINNIIKKNLLNNNNILISSNKNSKKSLQNNSNDEINNNIIGNNPEVNNIQNNNMMINNIQKNNIINNKNIIKNEIINKKLNDINNFINNKNVVINNNINNNNQNKPTINNNIPIKNSTINNSIPIKNNPLNNSIPNKNGIIINNKKNKLNNNYIMNSNVVNMINDNQMKKRMKRNMSETQQEERQQNQNNFFVNNYNENIEPNIRIKNEYNNNNIENNQITTVNKFIPNEIINYKIYDSKENNINNKINNINNKRIGYSNPQRNIKEENIIIIANKCDNIIKNNINNYYINQIGTINNNINNNINNSGNNINNSQNINNYNYQNNNNTNLNNKQNKNKKIIELENNNNFNLNNIKQSNQNNNMANKIVNNNLSKKKQNNNSNKHLKENNKVNISNTNQNDFEEIPQEINLKEFRSFNNTKILKNNIKNILGNNHKQILGINNDSNYYFLGPNYNTANNMDSNITPKNTKNSAKIMTNLSINSNGKKFKIIDSSNINNYNTSNHNTSNKKNHNHIHNHNNPNNKINHNNSKENKNKHNHNFNIIINTRKGFENVQSSPNQFLGRTSPRNNNSYKYDPIISNYNPIKKNKNNNKSISSNSKTKNYQNYETYENNSNNGNNINVNNYNISSSNKPLNNFNPNLIKRKGTPNAGHQMIKINNINNNPVKIKNNIFINNKKPSTPDMIINKSATMVNNNSYIGPKINNTNNIFNYSMNKSAHLNNNSVYGNKLKKFKNYNNMPRPATAPHKDKQNKEKRRNQVIHNIHETKKGINNFNKNVHKINQRPASAGQGKYNHNKEHNKEKDKDKEKIEKNNFKYSSNNLNGFNIGKKIEIDFGSKYKNSFSRKRVASPQILSNNKMSLGNNNKINAAKYRLPSPMIKSTSTTMSSGKGFVNNNINRSNTNYNMNKSASFNIK